MANWNHRYWHVVLLGLIVIAVALIRLRLVGVPFERDEGEYAYAAQLILQGIPPYELAYNMKFPGTYYAYALIMALFGETVWGVHFGLLLINLITTIFLYFLGKRFLGAFPAALGAAGFAVLSLDHWIMGVFAHATHFVLLPVLAGFLLYFKARDTNRLSFLAGAGALLGMSVLMKQHAIFFLLFGGVLLLFQEWRSRTSNTRILLWRMGVFSFGAMLPFVLVLLALSVQGVLDRFWFWAFQYAAEYASQLTLSQGAQKFKLGLDTITQSNWPLWLLSTVGYILLWIGRWPLGTRIWISSFALVSVVALIPGFFFREHYFILLLPAAGLGIALLAATIEKEFESWLPKTFGRLLASTIFLLLVGTYVVTERHYLFSITPQELSRARYGVNPFVEAVEIAAYINEHTSVDDRIAVIGSEPEIYFYANRKSATGYIYTYPLMEPHVYARRMQNEMIREIETARPKYLVVVFVQASWLVRKGSDRTILDWIYRYWNTCYTTVGTGERLTDGSSILLWDEDAVGYQPRTRNRFHVLKRSDTGPCKA